MLESKGEHIPPFLMGSIATNCNLYCTGCYARANKSCGDNLKGSEISEERWGEIFDKNKNLVPMISIEGDREQTDGRRGIGIYNLIMNAMDSLNRKGILLFAEYVPATKATRNLAPTNRERLILEEKTKELRKIFENIVFLSFPGDEKYLGGCLLFEKEENVKKLLES